jgi:hypothetical protein
MASANTLRNGELKPSNIKVFSTIGLISVCIVAVGFLLILFMKIPFGGAYVVTYVTLSKIKWTIVGLFSFLCFCRWIDDKARKT